MAVAAGSAVAAGLSVLLPGSTAAGSADQTAAAGPSRTRQRHWQSRRPPAGEGAAKTKTSLFEFLFLFFSVCVHFIRLRARWLPFPRPFEEDSSLSFAMAPSFDPIEAKMRAAGLSDAAVSAFKLNFDALAGGESGMVRKEE